VGDTVPVRIEAIRAFSLTGRALPRAALVR